MSCQIPLIIARNTPRPKYSPRFMLYTVTLMVYTAVELTKYSQQSDNHLRNHDVTKHE